MLLTTLPRRYVVLLLLAALMLLLGFGLHRSADGVHGPLVPLPKWMRPDHNPFFAGDGSPSIHTASEPPKYLEIFSQSTSDRKYFSLKFGSQEATNANIIPSAIDDDSWVIVAVKQRSKVPNSLWFAELVCEAKFSEGMLQCLEEPTILPIASTNSEKCTGDHFGFWGLNIGPHDGRVFYGPEHPYVIYGSNSQFSCFGLWMQDFRMLVDWGKPVWPDEYFRLPTDLQRPEHKEHNPVEKNWYAFWDQDHAMYIHYDTTPRRVFAEIRKDGSAGPDLGADIADHDEKCMKTFLPSLPEDDRDNTFHQATNSLRITMCLRVDQSCQISDQNTFILNVIQHKTFRDGHAEYDPYLYLFQSSKPFKLVGINPKPLWIHGREEINLPQQSLPHTQMLYVTSLSWMNHSQTYHGYLDDVMFLAFGIEDERPAAIDVLAADLLQGLEYCDGF